MAYFLISFAVMLLAALGVGMGVLLGRGLPAAGCGRDLVSGGCSLCEAKDKETEYGHGA